MTSDSGDKFAARGGAMALSPRRKRSEEVLRSTARTVIVAIVVLSALSYTLISVLAPRRRAPGSMQDRGGFVDEGYVENGDGGVLGPAPDDWDYGPDGGPLMQYPRWHHANYEVKTGGGDNDEEAATAAGATTSGGTKPSSPLPASYLTNSSVVLVTGAAGFIGSELVMALHRTYGPKRILCVDSLDSAFAGSGGGPFSAAASAGGATSAAEMGAKLDLEARSRTEDDLALLEYRRQRLFHVLQAVPTARFYKVDFRPSIPEYFDVGEVPVLDSIFERNPDISHVVHLADGHRNGDVEEQAVPRVREQTKTGMMEALLEQIRKEMGKRRSRGSDGSGGGPIQFVFASSSGVYNPTRPPEKKSEASPITAPGSLHGTSKVIDEVLAATYGSIHGISSVALRFFGVYGPWGPPGSPLFEMAERAVGDADAPVLTLPRHDDGAEGEEDDARKARDDRRRRMGKAYYLGGRSLQSMSDHPAPTDGTDLIYIDDAVDAVMSAMQLPLGSSDGEGDGNNEKSHFSSPLVFNVGSGQATTLVHAAEMMEKYFPRTIPESAVSAQREEYKPEEEPVTMYADTSRAASLLNWRPRVDLSEGIVQLLSWHYDRAFPYGPPPPSSDADGADGGVGGNGDDGSPPTNPASYNDEIASRGVAGCSPFDPECLRGAAVFPCSSECANPGMCVPGPYDAASLESRRVTSGCEAVLYTVALGGDVRPADLAGASVAASPGTVHHVEAPRAASGREVNCNVAFVTEGSEVWRVAVEAAAARRAAREAEGGGEREAAGGGAGPKTAAGVGTASPPMHGFWRLVALPDLPAPADGGGEESDADAWHREQHRDVLLPKLSPGRFFAPSVRTAIFAEPDLVVSDVPHVLELFRERPADREGGTAAASTAGSAGAGGEAQTAAAMMASRRVGGPMGGGATYDEGTARRENAYNAIRVALRGELSAGAGGMGLVDPSWLVHALDAEDARLFRCDVYAEVLQWSGAGPGGGAGAVGSKGADAPAFDFVTGLHDLWSRVIAQWAGFRPWWRDDGALVPSEEAMEKEVEEAAGRGEGDMDGEDVTVGAEEARKLGTDGAKADENTGNKKGEEEANAAKDDDGERDEDDEGEAGASNDAAEDEEDEEEKERAKQARRMARSTWMGVLSSKSTYQFVRVLPPSLGLVVKL